MSPASPAIAIVPFAEEGMLAAVVEAGGRNVEPTEADGIVWTNPRDPQGLKDILATSPARWVQLPFAGIESFAEAGVIDSEHEWTCAKGIYGRACAEHALALMLAAARRLHIHIVATTWREPGLGSPERRLKGTTVVIFGAGGIGSSLIEMLAPLGAHTIAVNRTGRPVDGADATVPTTALGEVVGEGDFVVITAALTPETKNTFDAPMLARMKPDAWLVNVARGGLVDTDALFVALREGRIGGAALDVTEPEPLPEGHPLWSLENAIITPHIANTWDMAVPELRALILRNVKNFVAGDPLEGPIDPALGY